MTTSRSRLFLAVSLLTLFAGAGFAQSIDVSIDAETGLSQNVLQIFLLISVLSIAPGILVSITCFPFVVTVLSILRQAIGLQQAPPNMLIIILSVFITYFVMADTFTAAWTASNAALETNPDDLFGVISQAYVPFGEFMQARLSDEDYLTPYAATQPPADVPPPDRDSPHVVIPSFLIAEISRAFQIGFLIYLPFLIIDLVVAAVLMSMGMMMVPPAIVSLPFKLAFFVVADGWMLISQALIGAYS